MDFLTRKGSQLRPGNLIFTMIALTTAVGLTAFMYCEILDHDNPATATQGASAVVRTVAANDHRYSGKNYELLAYLVAAVASSSIALGVLFGKVNKEMIKSTGSFQTIAMFLGLLVTTVLVCLHLTPHVDSNDQLGAGEDTRRDIVMEVSILVIVSIILGVVTVMSGLYKDYKLMGTGLMVLLTIASLVFTYLAFDLAKDTGSVHATDGEKLARNVNDTQEKYFMASLILLGIVSASGLFHGILENPGRLFGGRSKSPRRSPRRTSPKRKLGSLKPGRK